MFIITAKLPRPKVVGGFALLSLICCVLLALSLSGPDLPVAGGPPRPDPGGVRTAQDRVDYLRGWGWEVVPEPLAVQELVIPKQPDESMSDYLVLQADQGFPLERYAGKRVKRYTYQVTNYPTGEEGIQANLLVCRSRVVGGEVLSPQLDGFLHGLEFPASRE